MKLSWKNHKRGIIGEFAFFYDNNPDDSLNDLKSDVAEFLQKLHDNNILRIENIESSYFSEKIDIYKLDAISKENVVFDALYPIGLVLSQVIPESEAKYLQIDGITQIIGEGCYRGGVVLNIAINTGHIAGGFKSTFGLFIETSIDSWLPYSLSGKPYKHYLENSKRLKAVLNVLMHKEGWSYMVETRSYSIENAERDFIENLYDDDGIRMDDLEDLYELMYDPPFDCE